jgi:hypothetical protein
MIHGRAPVTKWSRSEKEREKREQLLAERDALLRQPLNGHALNRKERAEIAETVKDARIRQTFRVGGGSTWQRGKN